MKYQCHTKHVGWTKTALLVRRSRFSEGYEVVTPQGQIKAQDFDTEDEARDYIKSCLSALNIHTPRVDQS